MTRVVENMTQGAQRNGWITGWWNQQADRTNVKIQSVQNLEDGSSWSKMIGIINLYIIDKYILCTIVRVISGWFRMVSSLFMIGNDESLPICILSTLCHFNISNCGKYRASNGKTHDFNGYVRNYHWVNHIKSHLIIIQPCWLVVWTIFYVFIYWE